MSTLGLYCHLAKSQVWKAHDPPTPAPLIYIWGVVFGGTCPSSFSLHAAPSSPSSKQGPSVPAWDVTGEASTCCAIRGGNLHGVRGHMGRVRAPVFAGAGERDALLVAGKLDELAQLLLGKHLQCPPEELDVLVGLHQPHLVHGVGLWREAPDMSRLGPLLTQPPTQPQGVVMTAGHKEVTTTRTAKAVVTRVCMTGLSVGLGSRGSTYVTPLTPLGGSCRCSC